MVAIVKRITDNQVDVRVRRNCDNERLQGRHADLSVGDRVNVKRQINNPYLVRVPDSPR